MEELQYGINQAKNAKGMPGVYKLGGWYETASFADLHLGLDPAGVPVSLASPASASPLNHQGNWGIYGVADQMVWRSAEDPDRNIDVFLRPMFTPLQDRNLINALYKPATRPTCSPVTICVSRSMWNRQSL